MRCRSYTSAPIWRTGIRRFPPVSGVKSGFGAIIGCSTERHAIFLNARIRRILSAKSDIGLVVQDDLFHHTLRYRRQTASTLLPSGSTRNAA